MRELVAQRKQHPAATRVLKRELKRNPERKPRIVRWTEGWAVVYTAEETTDAR